VSELVQWILVALGALGAAGTWFRGWVAWKSQRHIEKWETFR